MAANNNIPSLIATLSLAEGMTAEHAQFILEKWLESEKEDEAALADGEKDPTAKELRETLSNLHISLENLGAAIGALRFEEKWAIGHAINHLKGRNDKIPTEGMQDLSAFGFRVQQVCAAIKLAHTNSDEPAPGRPKDISRAFVIWKLAELYEYFTGEAAARRVRGKNHHQYGIDYGPFHDFSDSVWQIAFGNNEGFSYQYRRWATDKKIHGNGSWWLYSAALQRPEWNIDESRCRRPTPMAEIGD
jgi:hypothetical protein